LMENIESEIAERILRVRTVRARPINPKITIKRNVLPQKESESQKKIVGRNEPCPCNSGKKYKKCCGK